MSFFLVVFDRSAGRLIEEIQEFDSHAEALEARFVREAVERDNCDIEVVVLGAASLEALKLTHRRYFDLSVANKV